MTRILLIGLGLALVFARAGESGTYTVNTSAKEDTLIQAEVDTVNQRQGTTFTNQNWVQQQVNESLRPLKAKDRDGEARQACQAFQALSPAEQAAIVSALGGKSPC